MLVQNLEECRKGLLKDRINTEEATVKYYEEAVKDYKQIIKRYKIAITENEDRLKRLIAGNSSEWAINIIKDMIRSNKDTIKSKRAQLLRDKDALEKERERLAELQADYRRRYSAADAKKALSLVERSSEQSKKSDGIVERQKLTAIHGGLYEPPKESTFQADDILSDEFKAWRKAQQKKQPTNQEGTT